MVRRYAALFLIISLHALMFYLVSRERAALLPDQPARDSRLIMLAQPRQPVREEKADGLSSQVSLRKRSKPIARAPAASPAPPLPREATVAKEDSEQPAVAAMPAEDPFNPAPRLDIGNLVKQASKADRDTRPAGENRISGPARDSIEAVMTRAFTAAKLAVPLKWYEAARIEMLTPPDARKPIYQVKTAFGTYCLYYPDKLMAGTGQPKVAECPHSFGR